MGRDLTGLKGKNILFIGPVYFGYEKKIMDVMEAAGGSVDFIRENIDTGSTFQAVLNKLPEEISSINRNNHFIRQIKKLGKNHYDIVFCIRFNFLTEPVMNFLKAKYPDAKYVLHYWDSCKNLRRGYENSKYFDRVSTFDRMDFLDHEAEGWIFRPLFYIPEYQKVGCQENKDIDLLYIATLSKERAVAYKRVHEYAVEHNLSIKALFYIRKEIYNVQKSFPEYVGLPDEVLRFESIPQEEIISLISRSKVMFDFSHTRQTGLTMRTIECVGACQPMATNNQEIKYYDFYKKSNVFLYEDNLEGLDYFVNKASYDMLEEDLYEKYSLENWVAEVLGV